MERVSVSSTGEAGNDNSRRPVLSADGQYVAFTSYASNLVSGDTNGTWDVFVHDRQTGDTTRVSVDSAGAEGNGTSSDLLGPAISSDGDYVAFYSWASNLVLFDTNNYCETDGDGIHDDNCSDAFVHDTVSGETTRVSLADEGLGPDLIVGDMYSAQTMENYCDIFPGLMVEVKNVGTMPAGTSTTAVSGGPAGTVYLGTPALDPGESVNIGTSGVGFGGTLTGTADSANVVSEVDETNNSLTKDVYIITLPPCTPVPPVTPSPTPDPAAVGGVAEPPDEIDAGGSGPSTGALALFAGAVGIVALTACGWYSEDGDTGVNGGRGDGRDDCQRAAPAARRL